jgi:hypothetical protein
MRNDVSRMWAHIEKALRSATPVGIIVLDDGGYCLAAVPPSLKVRFPIVGIEQTMSGLAEFPERLHFPVIEVASSAAKKVQ